MDLLVTILRNIVTRRNIVDKQRNFVVIGDMTSSLEPLLKDPRKLLLDLANQRELPSLLSFITSRLAESPRVALVRIWLTQKSQDCSNCPMLSECPNRSLCLHLVASAGSSKIDPSEIWNRTDGAFRRFPLGVRKVGRIGATGVAIEVPDLNQKGNDWIARPEWAQREGVSGFGGQPLIYHGKVLGVLAVFARGTIGPDCMDWLRSIADFTAAAITNSRAFAEIEMLKRQLEMENEYLREEVSQSNSFGELIGQSPALRVVTEQIELVANTDATVLILGESGTGKELVAREIHRRSRRADKPLIKVNCAAIPRELYESEFFGHVKGAFTGALRDRIGRFELADGGCLFLDEIGEIPLELQSKLLRVLQEGELERVGEERTRKVNFRLLAATNRNLKEEAAKNRFRSDLYYRLSVFPIEIPPLSKRLEDIPLLAERFLELAARKLGRPQPRLTMATLKALQGYNWPGNVRELQHVIERAVIASTRGPLKIELPDSDEAKPPTAEIEVASERIWTEKEFRQLEANNLRAALQASSGKIYGPGGAAELLGLKPTTLLSRLKSFGIET
jgi:transcriptional regulator with GAF, ATPase, and Fis domain